MSDYVEQLGALVLDHRLKRLMNRLLEEAACIYREQGVEFRPRWVSTSLLLEQSGPLTVTEIAARLRLTHPAVIQITSGMAESGLIDVERDRCDARRRLLSLSVKGRRGMPTMRRIWECLSRVQEEVFLKVGCEILQVIDAVEADLDEKSICRRVAERLGEEPSAGEETLPVAAGEPS